MNFAHLPRRGSTGIRPRIEIAEPFPPPDTVRVKDPKKPCNEDERRIHEPGAQKPSEGPGKGIDSRKDGKSTASIKITSSTALRIAPWFPAPLRTAVLAVCKLMRFIGPGFMVAVAYIDPGNYSTDVAAGANTRFALLFVVLMSNIFAIVLQTLAIRLGTITGMDLAQMCRAHLPKWLNIILYIFAESAIIATDIAEVIGSAIALNLLLKIPLVAGCAITILEVLVILFFYRPNGSMRGLKVFECGMVALVLAVVVCFCIQLSLITGTSAREVLRGYVPSSTVVQGQGIYLSCGILGATVMPHSLFLGSGIVKPRLKACDDEFLRQMAEQRHAATAASSQATLTPASTHEDDYDEKARYKPSMQAIKHCLTVSTVELVLSLCIFALFVNSAILITAGASLYGDDAAADADIFGIHDLLSKSISPAAGTIFALALLLSGLSAGIVCTIAGQMVSEGAINWTIKPWLRQLLTRSLSITPSIIIAGAVGRDGLNAALNGSQVALSIILPFVSAPLVYFTCRNKFMTVGGGAGTAAVRSQPGVAVRAGATISTSGAVPADQGEHGSPPVSVEDAPVGMRNHWLLSIVAILIWLVIVVMNVSLLVFLGLGKS